MGIDYSLSADYLPEDTMYRMASVRGSRSNYDDVRMIVWNFYQTIMNVISDRPIVSADNSEEFMTKYCSDWYDEAPYIYSLLEDPDAMRTKHAHFTNNDIGKYREFLTISEQSMVTFWAKRQNCLLPKLLAVYDRYHNELNESTIYMKLDVRIFNPLSPTFFTMVLHNEFVQRIIYGITTNRVLSENITTIYTQLENDGDMQKIPINVTYV